MDEALKMAQENRTILVWLACGVIILAIVQFAGALAVNLRALRLLRRVEALVTMAEKHGVATDKKVDELKVKIDVKAEEIKTEVGKKADTASDSGTIPVLP